MTALSKILDRLAREPVLFFGLFGLYITAYQEQLVDTDAKKAFVAAAVLWAQRTFSTSKRTADENVEVGKYVGALEAAPPQIQPLTIQGVGFGGGGAGSSFRVIPKPSTPPDPIPAVMDPT